MAQQSEELIEIRWKVPKRIHKKIAMYQKSEELVTMEQAGVILLEKVTESIKPIKI